jgi:Mce-associated membrane protein
MADRRSGPGVTAGERTDRTEAATGSAAGPDTDPATEGGPETTTETGPDVTAGSAAEPTDDEPVPAPPGETAPADAASTASDRGRRGLLLPAAAVLLLLLALAGAVLVGLGWVSTSRAEADRREITDVSTRVVNDFITIGGDNARQRSEDLLAVAAEPFRTELGRFSEVFGKILVEGKVSTDGRIDAVGIERADDDTAVVLVSASTTVRNSEVPDGAKRDFRMLLTLAHQEGSWKVSTVEVAP